MGAAVKRNIVHAPARRKICLLSVHTHSCRVRFFSGTNISPFPSLSFFSFLSYGSLSLSFSLFFPPSWLCKPTINPRRQLGISWRHDFTKPYRSPSTAAIQPTCILRCNFGRSCKRSIYLLCIPFGRWMVSYRLTWIFYRGIRIVRNAFEFFFFFFWFIDEIENRLFEFWKNCRNCSMWWADFWDYDKHYLIAKWIRYIYLYICT